MKIFFFIKLKLIKAKSVSLNIDIWINLWLFCFWILGINEKAECMKEMTLRVSEFVFLGLLPLDQCSISSLAFSTVFYVTIRFRESPCCVCSDLDPHLHSPMYFLLANLSFIDLCLSTLTVPKMISDLYSGHKTISFQGCVTQIFILHTLGGSEMVLLTAMALDRYVAICKPLHYLTIMSPRVCLCFCVVLGLLASFTQWSS